MVELESGNRDFEPHAMHTLPLPGNLDEQALIDAVDARETDAVERLCALVSAGSLLGEEAAAQELMREAYDALGLDVRSFPIDEERVRQHPAWSPSIVSYDGRPNVVGVHEPRGPVRGRSLILNGHIYVVPVGAECLWTRPPFTPWRDGDRLYGRGSADMKAGLVACVTAMQALADLGYEPAARIVMQSVVEEECTGNGALACLVEGYTADAALIPEPLNGIMSAQMGVMWLTLEVHGLPVHAAYAHEGTDAVRYAHYLVDALRELEAEWNEPGNRHPAFADFEHPVNFNLGRIEGGEWPSSVATHCRADLRLGYYPGVTPGEVRAEVERRLAAAHGRHPAREQVHYAVHYAGFQAEGLVVDTQAPIVRTLAETHRDIVGADPVFAPFTGTTDVKFFHLYGDIPSTCYGPVGADIHGIDEWVSVSSMQQVAAVYALLIARWCGLNAR
ncbi:MAG: ArgE/DapE family deacylase [Gammaproteobacteria bacterium]